MWSACSLFRPLTKLRKPSFASSPVVFMFTIPSMRFSSLSNIIKWEYDFNRYQKPAIFRNDSLFIDAEASSANRTPPHRASGGLMP